MNKKYAIAGLVLVLTVAVVGLVVKWSDSATETPPKTSSVTGIGSVSSSTVKEFQGKRQAERVDIYQPITEQWESSKHATALKSLKDSGHAMDFCLPCHSSDYISSGGEGQIGQVKYSVSCSLCHKLTSAGLVLTDNDRIKLCTKCHTAGEFAPGKEAHHAQAEIYAGIGAIGVPNQPNPKFQKGLACSDCHMPNQNHNMRALTPKVANQEQTGDICMLCHKAEDAQEFADQVEKLQKDTETRSKKIQEDLKQIQNKLEQAKAKGQAVDTIEQEYNVAFTNTTLVVSDSSRGVHNPKYINAILGDVEQRIAKINKLLK